MNPLSRLAPKSMAAQMIAVLMLSFVLLLAALTALEIADQNDVAEWAEHDTTFRRISRMKTVLDYVSANRIKEYVASVSRCHQGYTVTSEPWRRRPASVETNRIAAQIAREVKVEPSDVAVTYAILTANDFSYAACEASEIRLPIEGIVISTKLDSGGWLNTEIHPHEWHLREDLLNWIYRSVAVFLFVGSMAVLFVYRLNRPLARLTEAAGTFGEGLKVSEVIEAGPTDLRQAIRAFNAMQARVAEEVRKRFSVLAAISHDIRSPLTALRLKTELIDDDDARKDFLASIEKMEKITTSALEYLKGDAINEPFQNIDIAALLRRECEISNEMGAATRFEGPDSLNLTCRPEAISRAVRNLIENANKYAGHADVRLYAGRDSFDIVVSDCGPGIPPEKIALAMEPFGRLSAARESKNGGFGLGLAIANAVCAGHNGRLILADNKPSGLVATMRLPIIER